MFTTQCTVWKCSHVYSSWCCDTDVSDAGGVRFSLNGTTYQNNSLVTLEDIDEGADALLCLTDQPGCCRLYDTYTGYWRASVRNWFFPNGTRVPSLVEPWELYRSRGWMMVLLNRRRGGVTGIYSCVIPDAMNVSQTIYIGVYTASTGEWYVWPDWVGETFQNWNTNCIWQSYNILQTVIRITSFSDLHILLLWETSIIIMCP